MYTNILLPTDGSRLSEDAARTGIELARAIGARVTALHVAPEPSSVRIDAWAHGDTQYQKHIAHAFARHGETYLENIRETARRAGVPCDCALVRGDNPETEILREAHARGCDLIVMASHGINGTEAGLLASVTVGVATLGDVPVLIHHAHKA